MDVKRCDKCGAIYEPPEGGAHYQLMLDKRRIDLCDECLTVLRKWVPVRTPHIWAKEVRYRGES